MNRIPAVILLAWTILSVDPVHAATSDDAVKVISQQSVEYDGRSGSGQGKHIVFVTGDGEYRSEEGMPMLAKILAIRHGFRCTVLFAINPDDGTITPAYPHNIPGVEKLTEADLMVLFTRFRELPDEQMQAIVDFSNSGKPMIGLRTATHAFDYSEDSESRFSRYGWKSKDPVGGFGQLVFGETWVNHHGEHGVESTRGVINEQYATDPILRGCDDIWGPSDVYGISHLGSDAKVLVWGQVLSGMNPLTAAVTGEKNQPMMPVAWTREYVGDTGKPARVFCTTMGAATDLESAGLRRLLVNSCYWALGMEDRITGRANVEFVEDYKPSDFGFGIYKKGVKPSHHRLQAKLKGG